MSNPNPAPTCVAYMPHFNIRCGERATAVASQNGRSGPVCADCANRAVDNGWVITALPEVVDVPA